nr:MAG TPA: hypothetical protein [Caudoviricetes sp.]
MKNWEYNEEFLKKNPLFGVIKGELVQCVDISCEECDFGGMNCCTIARIEFLYQEHKGPIRLTADEKILCKMINRGWIARDSDGKLWWYENKPTRGTVGAWIARGCSAANISGAFPQCKFEFIKWEDDEPWEVQVND